MIDFLPPTALSRRLDEALERMEAGDDVVRAAGLNWSMASLQSLLRAAEKMHEIPKGVADVPAKMRVRNSFMSEAAGKRVEWVHSHATPLGRNRRKVQTNRHPIGSALALVIVAVAAIAIGAIAALAAGFSDPDSPLYPLKELGEGTLSAITLNPVSNADLKISYAQQRLREAEAMAARNEPDLVLQSMSARDEDLRQAAQELAGVSNRDAHWLAVRNRLEAEESRPLTQLIGELTQQGDSGAAQQLQAMATSFAAERKVLDEQLVVPAASPSPAASPRH